MAAEIGDHHHSAIAMDDDAATDAATQRLLDEIDALDVSHTNASMQQLAIPPEDDAAEPLASPTAQFFTFFAAHDQDEPDQRFADTEDESRLDMPEVLMPVASPLSTGAEPSRIRKASRRPAHASNRARNDRRHELAYLRRRVADLERELAAAQATQCVVAGPSHREELVFGQGLWQQIARRQRAERCRAELENVRLRAALETHLKVAKSLEMVMHKPTKSLHLAGLSGFTTSRVLADATVHATAADRTLLHSLLQHVEEIHAQADSLVGDSAAWPLSADIRTASRGSLAEILASDRLPFPLDAASKAAWKYFSYKKNQLPVPSRLYYERHEDDGVSIEDTVLESSGMECMANGVTAVVRLQQVLRRYATHDRVVIAWSAVSQPFEFGGKPFTGYDLREWGCMVLTPASVSERQDDAPVTVLRSCYFITPEFKGGEEGETECDIGRLTDCVLAFTTAGMAAWCQRIENILLDEQLAASRPVGTAG